MLKDLIWVGLVPVVYLIVAFILYKCPPKNRNSFYGYRTSRSMENDEIFHEANVYAGKLMLNTALIYFSISVFLIGITLEFNNIFWPVYWGILIMAIIPIVVLYIKTESYIREITESNNTIGM